MVTQIYRLELYVEKNPLTRDDVIRAVKTMESNGLSVQIDDFHTPVFGDISDHIGGRHDERAKLSPEQAIDLLVTHGGGSLPFPSRDPRSPDFYLRLYPMGWRGNRDRAKHLGESDFGEVPLGSLELHWELGGSELEDRDVLGFEKSIAIGAGLYAEFRPVFGFSYIDEVWEPRAYNLIPTEKNILEHGPRDLFPINFWSPMIMNKVQCDWARLAAHAGLSVIVFDEGGLLIHCTSDEFVKNYGIHKRERGERFLGWRPPNSDR